MFALLLYIGLAGPVLSAEEQPTNGARPLREAIRWAVDQTLPADQMARQVLVLLPPEPTELERFSAAVAQSHLQQTGNVPGSNVPIETHQPHDKLPDELGKEGLWRMRRSESEVGLLVKISDRQGSPLLLMGRYGSASARLEKNVSRPFNLEPDLETTQKADPTPLSGSDQKWFGLFKRLFPACQPEGGASEQLALAEGQHFFRRGLWTASAQQLAPLSRKYPDSCLLRRTFALQKAGQTDTVLTEVEKAIQVKPDSGPLYALKAWLLLRNDDADDALMVLQQARLSDMAREGYYRLARHLVALDQENTRSAREALDKAIQLLPDCPFTRLIAARFCWSEALLTKAIEHFRAAIEEGANTQDVWTELGMALDASGKTQKAIEAFRKAFEKDPADVSVARHLGNLLRGAGQYDDALEVLARAARSGPHRSELFVAWGEAGADMWRTRMAIEAYKRAAEIDGPTAQTGLARMRARMQEYRKAADMLEKVVAKHPEHLPAHLSLARVTAARGDTAGAKKILRKALKATGDEGPVHIELSRLNRLEGEHSAAIHSAQIAVAAESDCRAYATLARAYVASEGYEKARSALENGRKARDSCPELSLAGARLHAATGKVKTALETVQKVLESNPHQPRTMIFAGQLHLRVGQPAECARLWARAAELDRWNPDLEWQLAELLSRRLDRPEAAALHYTRHARLDGRHAEKARQRAEECRAADDQGKQTAPRPGETPPPPTTPN